MSKAQMTQQDKAATEAQQWRVASDLVATQSNTAAIQPGTVHPDAVHPDTVAMLTALAWLDEAMGQQLINLHNVHDVLQREQLHLSPELYQWVLMEVFNRLEAEAPPAAD